MAIMRAKMRIQSVSAYDTVEVLQLYAVGKPGTYPDTGLDEDNTYAKFTPSGELKLSIANPALIGKFKPGQTFYIDFTEVT